MTGLKTSGFYQTKNGMVNPTCELFNKHKVQGRPIKIVRCDSGGENIKLEKVVNGETWKLGIEFEYTGKQTPQRNAVVERGFATLGGRGRALMYQANVTEDVRYRVCKEVLQCTTMLDNVVVIIINGAKGTRYQQFYNKMPGFVTKLRTWGDSWNCQDSHENNSENGRKRYTCDVGGVQCEQWRRCV